MTNHPWLTNTAAYKVGPHPTAPHSSGCERRVERRKPSSDPAPSAQGGHRERLLCHEGYQSAVSCASENLGSNAGFTGGRTGNSGGVMSPLCLSVLNKEKRIIISSGKVCSKA